MPTEMTVLMLICVRMLVTFAIEAKRGAAAENATTMMTRASPMPASRRSR